MWNVNKHITILIIFDDVETVESSTRIRSRFNRSLFDFSVRTQTVLNPYSIRTRVFVPETRQNAGYGFSTDQIRTKSVPCIVAHNLDKLELQGIKRTCTFDSRFGHTFLRRTKSVPCIVVHGLHMLEYVLLRFKCATVQGTDLVRIRSVPNPYPVLWLIIWINLSCRVLQRTCTFDSRFGHPFLLRTKSVPYIVVHGLHVLWRLKWTTMQGTDLERIGFVPNPYPVLWCMH